MKKEKIKTAIIVVLLGLVILFAGIFYGISLNKDKPVETPENNTIKEQEEVTTDKILASIVGEWGTCDGEDGCRGIFIGKDDNDEYYFTPYIMWSEGGDRGTIKLINNVEGKKYKLTVYFAGYEDEMGSAPERTLGYLVDVSEVESDILYIENAKYQLITGDREEFFRSIMP